MTVTVHINNMPNTREGWKNALPPGKWGLPGGRKLTVKPKKLDLSKHAHPPLTVEERAEMMQYLKNVMQGGQ